jgi:hypothetical protein
VFVRTTLPAAAAAATIAIAAVRATLPAAAVAAITVPFGVFVVVFGGPGVRVGFWVAAVGGRRVVWLGSWVVRTTLPAAVSAAFVAIAIASVSARLPAAVAAGTFAVTVASTVRS